MEKREVVKYAREVLERDLAAIPDEYPNMPGEREDWLTTNRILRSLREASVDEFYLGNASPRPATEILEGAFKDLWHSPSPSRLRFAGEAILPLAETHAQTPAHTIDDTAHGGAFACAYAEDAFSACLKQVRSQGYYEQDMISVYHDEEGQPVLFRKSYDESTALSLVPLGWGDAVVPAGTVMAVDKSMSRSPTGGIERENFKVAAYLVPQAVTVTPVRLSAWAYENQLDRALFGLSGTLDQPKYIYYERRRAAAIENDSLADFVEAAHKVIEWCVD